MVRLAHTSDSLALPQAVACFVLLLSFAPPAALAQQYHVNGSVWKYGDILSPGTYADDSERTEEEPPAKNKNIQDDYGAEPSAAPQPKLGSNRHGTTVPRPITHRRPQLLQDDNGNSFLWLGGPGSTDGASDVPDNMLPMDRPAQLTQPRSRGAPPRRTAALPRRRRPGYYYYYYSVPVHPQTY